MGTTEQGMDKNKLQRASRGNPGASGVGVVARNDKGVILFKGAR